MSRRETFEEKVKLFEERTPAKLFSVDVFDHPGFRYTTPSAIKETLPAKERRKLGCFEKQISKYCYTTDDGKSRCSKVKRDAKVEAKGRTVYTKIEKKFTGGRCPPDEGNVCSEDLQVYDERCKAKRQPCESDRSACPVQLVWVKGKPNLRFCIRQKEPGYLVPVKDVQQAMKISNEACKKWPYQLGMREQAEGGEEEGWDPQFFYMNAPILTKARKAYPKSGGLGVLPRPPQPPQKGNPIWLAIGLAMGLAGAALLKTGKPTEAPST
ncbi:MAG: hypothetical protein ACE5F6_00035 [Anaerolineae bacterium]